jgi:hypothetical protein
MTSIPNRIMDLDFVQEGEFFTPKRVAMALNERNNKITAALAAMVDRNDIIWADGRYYKPKRHWIHQRKLANPIHDPDEED